MNNSKSNSNAMRYAGLATTWLVTLLAVVWIGYKIDQWLDWTFPLFIILLPVVALISLLVQIIREFSKPKK